MIRVSRMDLDPAASPLGLVAKILHAEPELAIPTPIEELCSALDITDIAPMDTEGFEGGLLTTPEKPSGIILVNKNASRQRQRFTIAHELGHFLIPWHQPLHAGKFLCGKKEMSTWDLKSQDKYVRMEAEANSFAANILMPPPALRLFMHDFRSPDIGDILKLARKFDVSKEAAARAYVEFSGEVVAVIFGKEGNVYRKYAGREFPFITTKVGQPLPVGSVGTSSRDVPEKMIECEPDLWTDMPRVKMQEQVLPQANGFSMILLHAQLPEEEDENEDLTSKQRYQAMQDRYRR